MLDDLKLVQEETIYNQNDKYPVFIILTYGDNPLGYAIHKITGDEWTHSLIAFNPELDYMYSFGARTQKSDHVQSPFGFVYQKTKDDWYKNKATKYLVYVMYVNKASITAMKNRLNYFVTHEKESKYDFKGILDIWAGKDTEDHRKFFCSRFVADIIAQGVKIDKLPSLYHPEDLKNLNNVTLVNGGNDMYFYNPEVTKRNLEYIKQKRYDKIKLQGDMVFYKNKIISEGEKYNMIVEDKIRQIVFEQYAYNKIDKDHYDLITEALSAPKLFGCKINYKESKIDKVTNNKNDDNDESSYQISNGEKVNSAVGIFNSSMKLKNKLASLFEETMMKLTNGNLKKSRLDSARKINFNYFNRAVDVKIVEAIVGENSVKFKCYGEPTSFFFKTIKSVEDLGHKKHSANCQWFTFTMSIPMDVANITDEFTDTKFIASGIHPGGKKYNKK